MRVNRVYVGILGAAGLAALTLAVLAAEAHGKRSSETRMAHRTRERRMKLWMIYAWETAALAALVAGIAVARRRRQRRWEHHLLALEEAQMLHDYLRARAEVAYLELKYAGDCAPEPVYDERGDQ